MAITIGNPGTPVTSGAATLPAAPQGSAPQPAAKVQIAVPEPAPQQQPQPEQIKQAMESLKQMIEAQAPNSLAFSIDESTGKPIVRITDVNTGDLIRQIPSEEMLEIARSLDKMQQGMLLRQEA